MTVAPTWSNPPVMDWPEAAGRTDTDPRSAAGQWSGLPLSVLHINGGLVIRPREQWQEPCDAEPLTDREREVLALVAEGYSNKLVGDRLAISERTVKSHLTDIMTRLRASDRTHAVVTAVRLGWLAI